MKSSHMSEDTTQYNFSATGYMKMIGQGHACQVTQTLSSCLLHHHIYINIWDTQWCLPIVRQVRYLPSNKENQSDVNIVTKPS